VSDGSTRAAAALVDANRPERALSMLAPILASHPDDSEGLRLAALACARSGRGREAVDFARSAARLAPNDTAVQFVLAEALVSAGQARAAAALARQLLAEHPGHVAAMVLLCETAATAGEHSRSLLKTAQAAVACAPLDPSTHHALGRVRMQREEVRRARRAFEQTLRLDPHHEAAHHNLALIQAAGLDLFGGARALAELGATSSDPEQEVVAVTRILGVSIYLSALVILFASSTVAAVMREPSSNVVARWVLAAVALGYPVLILLWARRQLGHRARALLGELRRRRFAMVVGACLIPLSSVAWVVAALEPSSGPDWYYLAMLPSALGAAVCWLSLAFRPRR